MTEPPEPRRPEEGGGEDWAHGPDAFQPDLNAPIDPELRGYEIEDEELSPDEWLDLLEEDAALDALHNAPPGASDDTLAKIADLIKGSVDDTDEHPTLTGRVERGEDLTAEPPGPRTPDNGGPVTATEDAAQLRALGTETYTSILGAIDVVAQALGQAAESFAGVPVAARNGYGAASGILGEGHANLNDINGATSALEELITPMQGEIESLRQQCNTLQQQAATIESTYAAAANAIGGGAG